VVLEEGEWEAMMWEMAINKMDKVLRGQLAEWEYMEVVLLITICLQLEVEVSTSIAVKDKGVSNLNQEGTTIITKVILAI
jgi:hypothetical protein